MENPTPTENAQNVFPGFNVGVAPFGQTVYFAGNADPAAGGDGGAAGAEGGGAQPEVHHFARLGTNPRTPPGVGHPAIFQFLEAMSAFLQQAQPQQFPGDVEVGRGGGFQNSEAGLFNPTLVMQGTLQNILGGGNVEIAFDNGTGGGPRTLPGNIGDYFFGPGLQQLIQHLAENDPNRYGTPPASKSAIESLPTIRISEEHLGTDYAQCAVCKDEFDLGAEVRKMPCKHMYHGECILPWLAQHNSCPVCRHELPTDDSEYNQEHVQQNSTAPASVATVGGELNEGGDAGTGRGFRNWGSPGSSLSLESPSTETSTESPSQDMGTFLNASRGGAAQDGGGGGISRRISFQLPWPFRFGSNSPTAQPETSGSGDLSQSQRPLTTQTGGPSGLVPSSDLSRTGERNGDEVAGEPQQEQLD
ncbi:hypothetical protein O6H91_14G039600 [Diphasiastrum complanatum]|nr:hypothetical protein O6H91_14G039600 [Diphasiastrum complanatum]